MQDNTKKSFVDSLNIQNIKNFQYFWIGFSIYSAAYSLIVTGVVTSSLITYAQLLGVLIFIPAAVFLISSNIEDKYLRVVFTIYCIWIVTVIGRGFLFEKEFIEQMIFDASQGLFLYFVPLVLLFPKNIKSLKIIFNVIVLLSAIYLFFVFLNFGDLLQIGRNDYSQAKIEYFSKNLSITCGFILLTFVYHSSKRNLWSLFIMLLTFGLAVIRARRGLMFMSGTILMISAILYFIENKGKLLNRFFPLILLPFVFMFLFNLYNANKSGLFSLITERADDDTRTGVEIYFYNDMETQDWIIGKGINGKYYCPGGFDLGGGGNEDYKFGIETDYLTIILKGGIISLGLLMLIAIPAIIKALFYSKNLLSKAAGIWILLWVLNLYPNPVTVFSLNYVLVWISIGICYSEEIRNFPEGSLREYFKMR